MWYHLVVVCCSTMCLWGTGQLYYFIIKLGGVGQTHMRYPNIPDFSAIRRLVAKWSAPGVSSARVSLPHHHPLHPKFFDPLARPPTFAYYYFAAVSTTTSCASSHSDAKAHQPGHKIINWSGGTHACYKIPNTVQQSGVVEHTWNKPLKVKGLLIDQLVLCASLGS